MSRTFSSNLRIDAPAIITSKHAWWEMRQMTNDFDPAHGLTREFVSDLNHQVFNARRSVYRGVIVAPTDVQAIKMIIGKAGCYFTLTSKNTDSMFIWHDRRYNVFVFYAQEIANVYAAMRAIQQRIDSVCYRNRVEKENQDHQHRINSTTLQEDEFQWVSYPNPLAVPVVPLKPKTEVPAVSLRPNPF